MKILYIITLLSWGGAQKYVYDLAPGVKSSGHDVSVAGGEISLGDLADKLKNQAIDVLPLKNLVREINPLKDLRCIGEIKRLIETEKPDVVHLNSSKAGVIGSIAAKLSKHKTKVIYTCHGWVFNESLNPLIRIIYLWLEKFTGRFKDKIICISEPDRQSAIKHQIIKPGNLLTVHNGIDLAALSFLDSASARKELGLPADRPITGNIANFYKTKGLKYLIEAADILINKQKQKIIFAIIGEGDLRPQLEEQIKNKNLSASFLLLGKKQSAAKYLKAFDVYVSSSVKEGVPYSILEAMAAGLPIIATAVGGVPEVIKNEANGLLIGAENPLAISEKINLLLTNDRLMSQLAQRAASDISDYSLERQISQTLAAYR